jgi:hypothetical protein
MLALSLVAAFTAAEASITLDSVLAQRRAGPAELRAETELAAARRAAVEASARQRESAVLGLEGGPRQLNGSTEADLAVDLEIALLRRGEERQELGEALAAAESAVRSAARAATNRLVFETYVDAWAAAERVELRQRDATLVARWLALARRRVEAGADPPFEAEIVASQLQGAQLALAQARAEALATWQALSAWAPLPGSAGTLAEPVAPALPSVAIEPGLGAAIAAVRARARLEATLLRLGAARDRSRWSLLSSVGREGDEEVTHVGFALRLPRPGEREAIVTATETAVRAIEREAEIETAMLAGRATAAAALLRELAGPPEAPDFDAILAALEARLAEGKDRPIAALALRREILTQLEEALARRVAAHRAGAELTELTTEVTP